MHMFSHMHPIDKKFIRKNSLQNGDQLMDVQHTLATTYIETEELSTHKYCL